MRRTVLLVVSILTMPAALAAQDAAVRGRVLSATRGTPVPEVLVTLLPDRTVQTDRAGRFAMDGLPAGPAELIFRMIGFREERRPVILVAGEAIELEVMLADTAIDLVPIIVRGDGELLPWLVETGFAVRRAQAAGMTHMTRTDLRVEGGNLANVLARVPGVRIRRLSDYGSELRLEPSPRPDGAPCIVGIYLNGSSVDLGNFRWTGVDRQTGMRPLRFDDLLRREDVDGLELYGPEESPVASPTDCGALLLWSADLRPNLDEPFVGALRGTVLTEATGESVPGAVVSLDPGEHTTTTDASGAFAFEDIVPAQYVLTVTVAGLPPWSASVAVKAFGAVDYTMRVTTRQ